MTKKPNKRDRENLEKDIRLIKNIRPTKEILESRARFFEQMLTSVPAVPGISDDLSSDPYSIPKVKECVNALTERITYHELQKDGDL